jgi:hypothetical protein
LSKYGLVIISLQRVGSILLQAAVRHITILLVSHDFVVVCEESTLLYVTDCRSNPRTDQVSPPIHSILTIPKRRVARNDGEK